MFFSVPETLVLFPFQQLLKNNCSFFQTGSLVGTLPLDSDQLSLFTFLDQRLHHTRFQIRGSHNWRRGTLPLPFQSTDCPDQWLAMWRTVRVSRSAACWRHWSCLQTVTINRTCTTGHSFPQRLVGWRRRPSFPTDQSIEDVSASLTYDLHSLRTVAVQDSAHNQAQCKRGRTATSCYILE